MSVGTGVVARRAGRRRRGRRAGCFCRVVAGAPRCSGASEDIYCERGAQRQRCRAQSNLVSRQRRHSRGTTGYPRRRLRSGRRAPRRSCCTPPESNRGLRPVSLFKYNKTIQVPQCSCGSWPTRLSVTSLQVASVLSTLPNNSTNDTIFVAAGQFGRRPMAARLSRRLARPPTRNPEIIHPLLNGPR